MSTSTNRMTWLVSSLVACAALFTACTGSDPAPTAEPSEPATPVAEATEVVESVLAEPTETPGPTPLEQEELAELIRLEQGEQVEDAQGNLIAIYGYAPWPETFETLSPTSVAEFPFFGDVAALSDPTTRLVALDVGMCSAGIDSVGVGTAEFFVHREAEQAISVDPVVDRGVLARHPVVSPGFSFPSTAACSRGWLPVLTSDDADPTAARYLLTTRLPGTQDVDRHLYQWDLAQVAADPDDALFAAGQTVTFNDGALAETTVVVDGWTELIGTPSPIEGTRMVGVSLTVCPSTTAWPEFGISLDGWNLAAPLDPADRLGAESEDAAGSTCFDGWLEFAVPFGAVPTGVFASDGVHATFGYAEWSLLGAALPTPQ